MSHLGDLYSDFNNGSGRGGSGGGGYRGGGRGRGGGDYFPRGGGGGRGGGRGGGSSNPYINYNPHTPSVGNLIVQAGKPIKGTAVVQNADGSNAHEVDLCQFYMRQGSCRHEHLCKHAHVKPLVSPIVMLPQAYVNPKFALTDEKGRIISYDEKWLTKHFCSFYERLWMIMMCFGRVRELQVADNLCPHLLGHVYVVYEDEASAANCVQQLRGKKLDGMLLLPELVPCNNFNEASCGEYDNGICARGEACNFLHLLRPPKSLIVDLLEAQDVFWETKAQETEDFAQRREEEELLKVMAQPNPLLLEEQQQQLNNNKNHHQRQEKDRHHRSHRDQDQHRSHRNDGDRDHHHRSSKDDREHQHRSSRHHNNDTVADEKRSSHHHHHSSRNETEEERRRRKEKERSEHQGGDRDRDRGDHNQRSSNRDKSDRDGRHQTGEQHHRSSRHHHDDARRRQRSDSPSNNNNNKNKGNRRELPNAGDVVCHICGETGHFAGNCKLKMQMTSN